jgi:hypothetical protein
MAGKFLQPIKQNRNMKTLKSIALAGALAVSCMELFSGCSHTETKISNEERLHRMADDAASLMASGYTNLTIQGDGWITWSKDGWSGMASPTLGDLKPGEKMEIHPPSQIR